MTQFKITGEISRNLAAALPRRHNGYGGVSNHQPHDCLLNRLFRQRLRKTSKLCVTGLCAAGEFPAQKASNAEMFPFDDAIMLSAKKQKTLSYMLIADQMKPIFTTVQYTCSHWLID